MDTSRLKKFAQYARRSLIEQVEGKLKLVLAEESEARREYPNVVAELEKKLKEQGQGEEAQQQLIEQVAYIWFNRFCALRFMDVNQYNRIMVISPLAGQFQPEILAEAKAGHIDDGIVNEASREKVFGLLNGSIASRDGQSEAFRLLIVAVCNDLHRIMPYLFERIEDYTELLMPDDLLSGNSILAYTREAMTPEACESVESIGWLYQFYISEKKDEVFDGLKKNKKITPENIPAATQLFTPHWIVRYLVENSLGRLWMLNNPTSKVIEQMDYYIKPVEKEEGFLKISNPEEIKVCDPACGSGHMLTYAYDLLYAIYLDAGYDSAEIPEKILTNNLYGIEIDERAAELAAFALTMKAVKGNPTDEGNNRRRFFRNPVEPNICRLEKISFSDEELGSYIDFAGKDLFTQDLRATLRAFEEADNYGSLIQPIAHDVTEILLKLNKVDWSNELFQEESHKKALKAFSQADYLSQKYHVVVANPPYMGGKGMNGRLAKWAKDNYSESKSDLFAMFIERDLELTVYSGFSAMINMQSWMFLSSFEKLRNKILRRSSISSMAHLGARAFDSIGGEVVSTTAYVLENRPGAVFDGGYVRLVDGKSEAEKESALLEAIKNPDCGWYYKASSDDFNKIPGSPIAYWVSGAFKESFSMGASVGEVVRPRQGMATTNNDRFLRYWSEVSLSKVGFNMSSLDQAEESCKKWFPYNKGGPKRKWYGNNYYVVNFEDGGKAICDYIDNTPGARVGSNGRVINREFYFKPGITWSDITTGGFAARISPPGFIFDVKGSSGFPSAEDRYSALGLLSSKLMLEYMRILNPTATFQVGDISRVPYSKVDVDRIVKEIVSLVKEDWDASEMSWNFKTHPLLIGGAESGSVEIEYAVLRDQWRSLLEKVSSLEAENNNAFIHAYGLSDDLKDSVLKEDITLNCNPFNRYGSNREDAEGLLLLDTVKEFISYSVGCMLGRYSLDKEGLILANQGDTFEEYLNQVPSSFFVPDDDNVIPLIDFDGDWFEDDITERFKEFLKATFGEENISKNLAFIEESIGKDIKKFFLKDFYADHVKRYKKRPIYWMFSSPKGSFNALIYMHRYRPDTVSVVLNDYLREFRTKLQARKESHEQIEVSASASQKEKTQAIKAIQKINKVLDEINDYEHDTLYPLAGKPPEIDLDDGVKHNYPLFGKALKKVTGLS